MVVGVSVLMGNIGGDNFFGGNFGDDKLGFVTEFWKRRDRNCT